jgi:phosphoribosylaminoimidazolecarboxamide formyltransferase / IMP cyclohydrolase
MDDLPEKYGVEGERVLACKYGENAWQSPAALYRTAEADNDPLAIANFELVGGTPLSYNNTCDVDRMLQTVTHIVAAFDINERAIPDIAVGVKHGNPCGAAAEEEGDLSATVSPMMLGDNRAMFGGLVMVSFPVDANVAEAILHPSEKKPKSILDGIVAPRFTPEAVELLKRRHDKCRLVVNPALERLSVDSLDQGLRFRKVRGGFLAQPNYTFVLNFHDERFVWHGERRPSEQQLRDLLLAWAIGSTSNSNTITIVKNGQLIGNGVGQQDRVSCCELAIKRARDAEHDLQGAVAYSDSFFPFADGPTFLVDAGVSAIFATTGSIRDAEIQEALAKRGISFGTMPDAVARGFFGH